MTDPFIEPVADPEVTMQLAVRTTGHACVSCGSPQARMWRSPDGPARLCPPCATLHGLGCP